jgi:hypothetical protein
MATRSRSEPEARAIYHPDCLRRLFKGGQHMYRADKILFRIEAIEISRD